MSNFFPTPNPANPYADIMLEMANFLASNLNMTIGENMFVGELPMVGLNGITPADGIYLVENSGPAPDQYVDTETVLFDVWSSSGDSAEAKIMLRRVYNILQRKGNYALVNWFVYFSSASGTIRDEDRGANGNRLFSQSWQLVCRNLNNIS